MSIFGSSSVPAPDSFDANSRALLVTAKNEIDGLADFFSRAATACQSRCMGSAHQLAELTVAETACMDRCVVKYMATQSEAGQFMSSFQEEQQRKMMAQQAAMQMVNGGQ